jgi:hypothetical protein
VLVVSADCGRFSGMAADCDFGAGEVSAVHQVLPERPFMNIDKESYSTYVLLQS